MALSPQERGRLGAEKRWRENNPEVPEGEVPKYRVLELCYHKNLEGIDRLYDPESTARDDNGDHKPLYLETYGIPAHYMEPANDAAKAMVKKYPPADYLDPRSQIGIQQFEAWLIGGCGIVGGTPSPGSIDNYNCTRK